MSTTSTDMQLNQLLQVTQEIKSELSSNRLLHVLETVRDQVERLSNEHENIRDDLREIMRIVSTPAAD